MECWAGFGYYVCYFCDTASLIDSGMKFCGCHVVKGLAGRGEVHN